MAKIKVVNGRLGDNLTGGAFDSITNNTVFSFGGFTVTSNFGGGNPSLFLNTVSSFVKPITLDKLNIDNATATYLYDKTKNTTLNQDWGNLSKYVKFGSTQELLRVSIQNILETFPASLYVSPNISQGGNVTFFNNVYDEFTNVSTFNVFSNFIINKYQLLFNEENTSIPNGNVLANLNLSYSDYVCWLPSKPEQLTNSLVGFTGDSQTKPYITLKVIGNIFSGETTGNVNFHIRPNILQYNKFFALLSPLEKFLLSNKNNLGYSSIFNIPNYNENSEGSVSSSNILWTTSDGYNLDYDTSSFTLFSQQIANIGFNYDNVKSDLLLRQLVPSSLVQYDLTNDQKWTKLMRIYGREFDNVKQYIDALATVHKVTYDKKDNIPDQLVKNYAKTLGWDVCTLVSDDDIANKFFSVDNNQSDGYLLPSEIDIELWRRILINTSYFWKYKGTRSAIKSMMMLIGVPEPFINITEYVYTVDGKINANDQTLSSIEFGNSVNPFDNDGYPIAPIESPNFYFQISGNTDSGQYYMDNFRKANFTLNKTIDNKKSWPYSGETNRIGDNTPKYYQLDSKLVLNTKQVNVSLDVSRGIEYDIFYYIKNIDIPYNSSGFTAKYTFVNIAPTYENSSYTFNTNTLPVGGVQVNFNGIVLTPELDYTVALNATNATITLNEIAAKNHGNGFYDVILLSYLNDLGGTPNSIEYVVSRPTYSSSGTIINLPKTPSGDVQLSYQGVGLVQSSSLIQGDYIVNPNNPKQLLVQNQALLNLLSSNPNISLQVACFSVSDDSVQYKGKNEFHLVTSFSDSKFYYKSDINRTVYRLGYKISDTENIRVMVNGISLTPYIDYYVNTSNQYEIILPMGIKFGDVIGVNYLIYGDIENNMELIIKPIFGVGDISEMTFLEFINAIQSRLINARNRKVITDNLGGFYPTLLKVYYDYIKRSLLSSTNPLKSNGYTFEILYPFLDKYNAYFNRFVKQLLSATIINERGGILVRNSVFTRQKHKYLRGVSYDENLKYFGSDASIFKRRIPGLIVDWSDESVCTADPCEKFKLTEVEIVSSIPAARAFAFGISEAKITPPPIISEPEKNYGDFIVNLNNVNSANENGWYEIKKQIDLSPIMNDSQHYDLKIMYDIQTFAFNNNIVLAAIQILKNGELVDNILVDYNSTISDVFVLNNISYNDYVTIKLYNNKNNSESISKSTVKILEILPSAGSNNATYSLGKNVSFTCEAIYN